MDNHVPWYQDAIIYELHVRAFHDGRDDGTGDFRGLAAKLDYLQDLGVTSIWLLPFFPSPWRDDGYDISDYTDVHPAYGTLADFERFLSEAHRRGLRVITEIVLNHTSDQHAWFQRSRHAPPGSKWRDFYVWSDTPERYKDARIIFQDFETSNWAWDPVAKAYYWHRFYSHQPDLNYDSPHVVEAMKKVIDFWFDLGVDGFRLDAVPYLFEREGTNCENLPETHAFLRDLRSHVDARYPDRMLLSEANQWPEDAIAYFGKGDESHMAFHFPLMPRLFMAARMEDRFPIVEILELTPPIAEGCQWATFLRNHDELTLEMVTDEERDYMYRAYAYDRRARVNLGIRRRLAPLLGNDRRMIELMNALLFSLPGTPVIYYGDEIGMGDNIYLGDRDSMRTPMQWSADRNAGFSHANPQRLYLPVNIDPEYHYETVNVEAQLNNPHSLLWWMKRLIEQSKQFKAFGRGTLGFLNSENHRVLAFLRCYENEKILVVANLSRHPQHLDLDLSEFTGATPVEVFGGSEFPRIEERPYALTLGGHGFYWFSLEDRRPIQESVANDLQLPEMRARSLSAIFEGASLAAITGMLPSLLRTRRWFLGRDRTIRQVAIVDVIAVTGTQSWVLLARVDYVGDEESETYLLYGSMATGEAMERVRHDSADSMIARVRTADGEAGVIHSAVWNPDFDGALLTMIGRRRRLRSPGGELIGVHTKAFRSAWGADHPRLEPAVVRADQRNSSVVYGDRFILKLYRRVESGPHPEIEVGQFLASQGFANVPALTGWLEYRSQTGVVTVAGILHSFVPNQGDAWDYTLHALGQFFEAALARDDVHKLSAAGDDLLTRTRAEIPAHTQELLGPYAESARLMGRRIGELHVALTADPTDPVFAPEPFSKHYQQSLYYGLVSAASRSLDYLRQRLPGLNGETRAEVLTLLANEDRLKQHFRNIRNVKISGSRTRVHGDLHLGQLLHTGKDFVIIDFEGESHRSLSERRIKRSPLRDVAAMLRSFEYAASASLLGKVPGLTPRAESIHAIEAWARYWADWAGALFLNGYLTATEGASFLPTTAENKQLLLHVFQLERAVFELSSELTGRPDWLHVPLRSLLRMLDLPIEQTGV